MLDCALAACAAGDVASLLVSAGPSQAALAEALTGKLQGRDVAVLIEGDSSLATRVKADGVMITGSGVAEARRGLDSAIVGARCNSRHEAMEAGEAGADFIAFSGLGLIAWWAEIFEIPAVSLIPGAAAPGAQFVRPSDDMWQYPPAPFMGAGQPRSGRVGEE